MKKRTATGLFKKDAIKIVKDISFYKKIAVLSIPIAAQNVITYLVSLLDNIMVGRLGEAAVSGVFIANQVTTLLQMFVTGVSAALMVLAAQFWGKRDAESVKSIVSTAFKLCLIVSACLWALMFFYGEGVLSLFTNDSEALKSALIYVRIVCFTYIPFSVSNVLVASMRCVETVRLGTYSALTALIINFFLNWILIFGKLGMPRLGIAGVAIATLTARIVEMTITAVYVLCYDKMLKTRFTELFRFGSPFVRDFFKYGAPVIAGDLFWGVNISVQGGIVGHLGVAATAAVSIANVLFSLISVGSYGIRDGAAIIIGQTVGTGDIKKVREYAKTMQVLFLGVGLITGFFVFLSRLVIPFFYISLDTETLRIAKQMLSVLSVTIIGTSYQMATLTGIVRAGGATHFVLINDLIHVWLIVIPSALLAAFVFNAPAFVVFACLKSDQILKCWVAFIKCNRYNWIKNLTRPQPAESAV